VQQQAAQSNPAQVVLVLLQRRAPPDAVWFFSPTHGTYAVQFYPRERKKRKEKLTSLPSHKTKASRSEPCHAHIRTVPVPRSDACRGSPPTTSDQHAKPWKENPATASKRPAVSPLQTQAPSPCLPPSLACSALLARIPASLRDGKPAPAPRSPCPGLPRSASRPSVSRLISVRAMARRGVPVAVVVEWPDNPDLAGFKLSRGCARGLFLGFP
jgi:hypothetical protein